jgi:hypothetical protein
LEYRIVTAPPQVGPPPVLEQCWEILPAI